MSNEQSMPGSRDYRTGYGQTAYKRQLAYKQLGIDPALVPCVPFFRASLTRIGRLLNRPRIKPESGARLIRPLDCRPATILTPAKCRACITRSRSPTAVCYRRKPSTSPLASTRFAPGTYRRGRGTSNWASIRRSCRALAQRNVLHPSNSPTFDTCQSPVDEVTEVGAI